MTLSLLGCWLLEISEADNLFDLFIFISEFNGTVVINDDMVTVVSEIIVVLFLINIERVYVFDDR